MAAEQARRQPGRVALVAGLLAAAATGLTVAAVLWRSMSVTPGRFVELQWMTGDGLIRRHERGEFHVGDLLHDVRIDDWAVLAYTLGSVALATALLGWRRRWTRAAIAGVTGLILAGALADLLENRAFRRALHTLEQRPTAPDAEANRGQVVAFMHDARVFGALKWGALLAAAALVAVLLVRVRHRSETSIRPTWSPPPEGQEHLGICLSGGGIRSASFSLGVLQRLDEAGILRRARYLAAVSGGGYVAAGWAVSQSQPGVPSVSSPPPWTQGSPEERWFRNHSSYLIPGFLRGLVPVVRLVAGLLWNLLLIWLLVFVVARPVGWFISALHPELRTTHPLVTTPDPEPEVTLVVNPHPVTPPEGQRSDLGQPTAWYALELASRAGHPCTDNNSARLEIPPYSELKRFDVGQDATLYLVASLTRPGLVRVTPDGTALVQQPTIALAPVADPTAACTPEHVTRLAPGLTVGEVALTRHLDVKLTSATAATPDAIEAALEVTQPAVRPQVGLLGREPISVPSVAWWFIWPPLLLAAAAGLVLLLWRSEGRTVRTRRMLPWVVLVPAGAGAAAALVVVVLPWLLQEGPPAVERWFNRLPLLTRNESGLGSGFNDYLLPVGGALALVAGTVRAFLRSNQSKAPASLAEQAAAATKKLGKHRDKLGWYEWSVPKIVAGLIMVVVPVVLFVSALQLAAANGPRGRLSGPAVVRDALPATWMHPEDWQRWLLALAVLALAALFVDAHAWSLYPFYKRRLSETYLLRRSDGGEVEPVPYDEVPVTFGVDRRQTGLPTTVALPARPTDGPQVVVCCAVNLSEPGVTPPARRAASFTFSSTEIGGPLVGYQHPVTYWQRLPLQRQRDLTVPSAMAISGAAFSPAMGKFNLGPVGSIFAVANLRLGVWLPRPGALPALQPGSLAARLRRPGWTWWLREVLGCYWLDAPYLYVSDGGHWENLGLVELLRRGCTEIVCVNAGGDSQHSFSTIGEAVALAREELGVEIELDPSPLRPPLTPSAGQRPFRREPDRDADTPLAAASFVEGTIHYPPSSDGRRPARTGRIWLIEPALTGDLPLDVHAWAERAGVFPDDSTGDQVFNHQQFEAFRALGHHQADRLVADARL